ncbi:MAG: tRNA (adenosine(37)-N6)-threonylcarbamoyltransferase complex ATPase subunit type 1 TsaE [Oscillospiraceae bacterium]|nr:tRNA (adenosine(37)-N6)-threonylcarbamoyltransferase complex ATPase subunit type 1 TsaE [Oscillospiraceae bacterium]
MTVITASPAETQAFAEALAAKLPGGTYLAFRGGLGVGKTTFCHGLARGLGCVDEVSSPTFSIVNYYRGPRPLAHFDMYRISSRDDLETTGFFDYLDAGAVVAAEWSENVEALTGAPDVTVTLEALDEQRRRITVEGVESV